MDQTAEQKLFGRGFRCLAGIDEAGRGPLAGPVVAGLVIISDDDDRISENKDLEAIKDSKKLTPKKREELFKVITSQFPVAVGICDNQTIDRINIRQACFLAIKKALGEIKIRPDLLLLDGDAALPNCSYPQKCIKHGDALIFAIAAASIIAKVTRDRMMMELHEKYPDYGFDRHKGYGTQLHLENLKKHGPAPVHRYSFKPVSRFKSV